MEKNPSQLEQYLRGHHSEGVVESSGAFTLAREKALAKLAKLQLPFAEAWTVKIVQAAVAAGVSSEIRVSLMPKEARFVFSLNDSWSLDEIEESFFDPEPGPNRSLNHLTSALWAVGLNEMRSFCLALSDEFESLVWDGSKFSRLRSKIRHEGFQLDVSHSAQHTPKQSWFGKLASVGSTNAEIGAVLARYCFACPVPLSVDAVRMDSLQLCPDMGWSKEAYPMNLSFLDCDSPSFCIPGGTFEQLPSHRSRSSRVDKLDEVGRAAMEGLVTQPEASAACLISVHMHRVKRSNNYQWEATPGPSKCYWLADGVLVDAEVYDFAHTVCSAGIFLSADGLETDLTSLRLLESSERKNRKKKGGQAVLTMLESVIFPSLDSFVAEGRKQAQRGGALFAVVGVATMWVNPVYGVGFLGAAALAAFAGNSRRKNFVEEIQAGIGSLRLELVRNLESP